jgi:hypothetical protein
MSTMQQTIARTVQRQRRALQVEPIHTTLAPVRAYAAQIAALKGEAHCVVTIPAGSAAHCMGYRFVSIPESEAAHYLANGATRA